MTAVQTQLTLAAADLGNIDPALHHLRKLRTSYEAQDNTEGVSKLDEMLDWLLEEAAHAQEVCEVCPVCDGRPGEPPAPAHAHCDDPQWQTEQTIS